MGDCMTTWLIIILQIVFFLTFAPLLAGWIKWLKCHMQNRTAPSIFQPYKNLNKLFIKQTLKVEGASWLFSATPYILFCIILTASTLMPSFVISATTSGYIPHTNKNLVLAQIDPSSLEFSRGGEERATGVYNNIHDCREQRCQQSEKPKCEGYMGDAIVLVGLLALARVFLALAGLDIGTAFGGIGSSREMMIAALTEPSLLLIFLIMAMKVESSNLPIIVSYINQANWGIYIYPSFIFVFLSLIMITIAETGRIPIDNPATHLELTMTHEAMILEYSGKNLGLIEWSAQIKTLLFFVIISNLFFPWGITSSLTLSSLAISLLALCGKLLLCAVLIVLIETVLAKMRLFKAPYFLGIAFALCLLGILSHILFES